MALIHAGSCVGVLYWSTKSSEWKVHNGRLVLPSPVDPNHSPSNVSIAHWTIPHKPHAVPHKEILPISNVAQVRLTPDLSPTDPRYCSKYRGNQNTANTIYPGTCFGVYFSYPNGGRDVKNGRFVFWEKRHDPGRFHCVIHRNKISDIAEVYYVHYYLPKNVNKKDFMQPPEMHHDIWYRGIKSGEIVTDVFRTTMSLLP